MNPEITKLREKLSKIDPVDYLICHCCGEPLIGCTYCQVSISATNNKKATVEICPKCEEFTLKFLELSELTKD